MSETFGGRRGSELATLEFRAEFFNIFNFVNFDLPSMSCGEADSATSARPREHRDRSSSR
jgi:hypothetical protein